jgi:murein DD-endopeptidase MepM/ murein hydrolase activator NlpD
LIRRLLSPLPFAARNHRAGRRVRAAAALLLVLAAVLAAWARRLDGRVRSPLPVAPTAPYDGFLAVRSAPGEEPLDLDRAAVPQPFSLRWGQTLGGLLQELGLDASEAYAAAASLSDHVDPRKIRAGEAGVAYFDPQGDLASLRLEVTGKGRADLARRGPRWESSWRDFVRETRVRQVSGELSSFLEGDVVRAGGRPQLAYGMSEVLQWDLDFNRDLRLGDRFQALYEEIYLDAEFYDLGRILALVYENRGRRLEAYRYGDGYYDAEGRPLRKMFLRSPLRFTRITSRFSNRRFHPILKVNRPHYGVDYGAPRGTPARVTAGGVVIFAGTSGGSGKMVKVRHPNGYLTAYLHLSGYGPGVRSGKRVAQGDTIGYVGATGLATAPHLDYRVQKDGRWIDPLKLKSLPAEPIPAGEMADFVAARDRLRGELAAGRPPRLAERSGPVDRGVS